MAALGKLKPVSITYKFNSSERVRAWYSNQDTPQFKMEGLGKFKPITILEKFSSNEQVGLDIATNTRS